jgi:hypothetical protein
MACSETGRDNTLKLAGRLRSPDGSQRTSFGQHAERDGVCVRMQTERKGGGFDSTGLLFYFKLCKALLFSSP